MSLLAVTILGVTISGYVLLGVGVGIIVAVAVGWFVYTRRSK